MIGRAERAIAIWEYRRYAKPRDLVIGTVIIAAVFGLTGFVQDFAGRKRTEPRDIAVVGAAQMKLDGVDSLARFNLHTPEAELDELEQALSEKEYDALLIVESPDAAELRVRSESGWQSEFLALVSANRMAQRPEELNLDPGLLAALNAPVVLERVTLDSRDDAPGQAGTMTVMIVVGTMLLGLFLGFSYVFVAITSEKTQRVTEAVLSAITPQQWIDGKILGLTLAVLANMVCYAVGYLLYKVVAKLIFGAPFVLPTGLGDPMVLVWVLLFAVLGFGFWLTLFAIVASTISDPNSSSRSALLFLPFVPLGLTLTGLDQADSVWMRVISLIPGLSPAAMPVRLLRGDPSLIEILVAIVLLVGAVWLFRRAAGRIFGVSMLMTGKEPSWREVWRWAREA